MSQTSHKQYFVIFFLLFLLTVLEVGCTQIGLSKLTVGVLLVAMALSKAGMVAFYYMHLGSETRTMKWMVLLSMMMPPIYAAALMIEAFYRMGPAAVFGGA